MNKFHYWFYLILAFLLAFTITLCHDLSITNNYIIFKHRLPQVILTDSPRELDDELQVQVEPMRQPITLQEEEIIEEAETYYSAGYFMSAGVIYWDGWRWTWYSQQVLPGGGLNIPGRHVDENGYVCDENEYICLASSSLGWGTIVNTPFGKQGRVYDSGCDSDVLDVYVNW